MKTTFAAAAIFAFANATNIIPEWGNLTPKTANKAMIGSNIGGWLVIEPWITPSLFYRFLGKTHSEGVGIDSSSFCEALGAKEANKVLRAHWDNWITEK